MLIDSAVSWGESHIPSPLPWHDAAYQQLSTQQQQQRLSHAYLVSAEIGTGALQFVYAVAAGLLCRQANNLHACGECKSCHLIMAGSHGDARLLMPENGKVIKIDQVREAINFAANTAQQGGYRVMIISPAESLNTNAANALLKLLEEPGEKTVLLLVTYTMGAIPATLRSRCQKIALPPPSVMQAQEWLEQQDVSLSRDNVSADIARPLVLLNNALSNNGSVHNTVRSALSSLLDLQMDAMAFAKTLAKLEPIDVIDATYDYCLLLLKQGVNNVNTSAYFNGLDDLVLQRKALLNGATTNFELYLHSWAIKLIKSIKNNTN